MAITRTINYIQNVPVSMGFSNVLTASAGTVLTVTFDFQTTLSDSKMGSIVVPATAGVKQSYQSLSSDQTITPLITLTGTTANLNTALNGATFQNHYYTCETVTQDLLSQDRTLSDYRGELQIQISSSVSHGLSVGSACRISSAGRYIVTAIDGSNSATRIWLAFNSDYGLNDQFYNSLYKNVTVCKDNSGNALQTAPATKAYTTSLLQNDSAVTIAPITDVAFINPHGNFDVVMTVANGGSIIDSGTISFNGSFFINEPTFTSLPPTTISAPTTETTYNLNMGSIAQSDDNYQSVQLLIKCFSNDPMYLNVASYSDLNGYPSGGTVAQQLQFIGDAITAKSSFDIPKYAINTDYGIFGNTQVDARISSSPTTGVVRWHFYGTPADCNVALSNIKYFRPPNFNKDFKIETRIVNGRTRIYSSKGK